MKKSLPRKGMATSATPKMSAMPIRSYLRGKTAMSAE
jgi:hypothetical protein